MRVDDPVVAGSHGFDIWSPAGGAIESEERKSFAGPLREVTGMVSEQLAPVSGALAEPKKSSVAVHYRLVGERESPRIRTTVDAVMATHPHALRVTPGKMVYEIQPKLDWDKVRAVLYLLEALGLDREDVPPLHIGDDITDEDAFRALAGRGVRMLAADPADREIAGRRTAADFVVGGTQEVKRFLHTLVR